MTHLPDQDDINAHLLSVVRPGDKVIFFGGDDFFRMADAFTAELARRAAHAPQAPELPEVGSPRVPQEG